MVVDGVSAWEGVDGEGGEEDADVAILLGRGRRFFLAGDTGIGGGFILSHVGVCSLPKESVKLLRRFPTSPSPPSSLKAAPAEEVLWGADRSVLGVCGFDPCDGMLCIPRDDSVVSGDMV